MIKKIGLYETFRRPGPDPAGNIAVAVKGGREGE